MHHPDSPETATLQNKVQEAQQLSEGEQWEEIPGDTRFGWKNSSIRALRGRRVTHFQSIFTHAYSSWPHPTLADPLTQVKPIWTGEPSCVQSYSSQE